GWWRDAAQRLLVARKDSSAAPLLRRLYESTTRAETRVHALWTLEGLRELDEFTLLSALAYPHPRVREHALRLAEPLLGRSTKIAAAVLALVRDESPRVRVQTAAAILVLLPRSGSASLNACSRTRGW